MRCLRSLADGARSGRSSPAELAEQYESSEQCIRNWVKQADRDAGKRRDSLTLALLSPLILARSIGDAIILTGVRVALGVGGISAGVLLALWGGPKRRIHGVLIGWALLGLSGDLLFGWGAHPRSGWSRPSAQPSSTTHGREPMPPDRVRKLPLRGGSEGRQVRVTPLDNLPALKWSSQQAAIAAYLASRSPRRRVA